MFAQNKKEAFKTRDRIVALTVAAHVTGGYAIELMHDDGKVFQIRNQDRSKPLTYTTLEGAKGVIDYLGVKRFSVRLENSACLNS